MAKQKSRPSRISKGGRQKANVNHEAKRQAYFARRRESGKVYEYTPIAAKKGTEEYEFERLTRVEKNKTSRLEYAVNASFFRKVDNEIAKAKEIAAAAAKSHKKAAPAT